MESRGEEMTGGHRGGETWGGEEMTGLERRRENMNGEQGRRWGRRAEEEMGKESRGEKRLIDTLSVRSRVMMEQ